LKKYLTTLHTLVASEPHETLQLYISTGSNVVSTMIVVKQDESDTNRKILYLVYFVSEVLSDSKTWYFYIMKPLQETVKCSLVITDKHSF
jgi:hypothetical protein